jgi:hypothetical protein
MPTTHDRLIEKLHVLLKRAFVEARNLALAQRQQQLFDLADTFEALPSLIAKWSDEHLGRVRGLLANYQAKYPDRAYDYLSILDMDERAFQEVFRDW